MPKFLQQFLVNIVGMSERSYIHHVWNLAIKVNEPIVEKMEASS